MANDDKLDGIPGTLALLRSVLDGSFDAGALIDGHSSSNGEIIHLNDPARDLFECRSAAGADDVKTIGQLISFWSPTQVHTPASGSGSPKTAMSCPIPQNFPLDNSC